MFKNYIKEAKILNQINLDNRSGIKVYHNKLNNTINLALFIILLVLVFILFLLNIENTFHAFYISIGISLLISTFYEPIGNLIIKNPVFILENEKLYYLKTNQWYDIYDYKFEDKMIGRHNYFETFCMLDKKDNLIFSEKNWTLKKEDKLKGTIKYLKLSKLKTERQKRQ